MLEFHPNGVGADLCVGPSSNPRAYRSNLEVERAGKLCLVMTLKASPLGNRVV